MVIADVQREDAGKYSCIARNKFGEASCEATVTVSEDKLLYLPEGFLEPGMEPHFTWLRDGKPFDPEERFKVLFQDNEDTLALVFQHVKPEDAGLYTCVAQTSTGNDRRMILNNNIFQSVRWYLSRMNLIQVTSAAAPN